MRKEFLTMMTFYKEVLALVPEYTEFVHLETIVARQAERIKELEQDGKTLSIKK